MENPEQTDLLPWILSAAVMLIMGIAVATYSDEASATTSALTTIVPMAPAAAL